MEKFLEYLVNVSFSDAKLDMLGEEESTIFQPFSFVRFDIQEIRKCPFCGKVISGYECNCLKFQKSLKQLRKVYGNGKFIFHEMKDKINPLKSLVKISCISYRKLNLLDMRDLKIKFTKECKPYYARQSYTLSSAVYDGQKVVFYVRDDKTTFVYLCEYDFKHSSKRIGFGEKSESVRVIYPDGSVTVGDCHIDYSYDDLIIFKDWNQVCVMLEIIAKRNIKESRRL